MEVPTRRTFTGYFELRKAVRRAAADARGA